MFRHADAEKLERFYLSSFTDVRVTRRATQQSFDFAAETEENTIDNDENDNGRPTCSSACSAVSSASEHCRRQRSQSSERAKAALKKACESLMTVKSNSSSTASSSVIARTHLSLSAKPTASNLPARACLSKKEFLHKLQIIVEDTYRNRVSASAAAAEGAAKQTGQAQATTPRPRSESAKLIVVGVFLLMVFGIAKSASII